MDTPTPKTAHTPNLPPIIPDVREEPCQWSRAKAKDLFKNWRVNVSGPFETLDNFINAVAFSIEGAVWSEQHRHGEDLNPAAYRECVEALRDILSMDLSDASHPGGCKGNSIAAARAALAKATGGIK